MGLRKDIEQLIDVAKSKGRNLTVTNLTMALQALADDKKAAKASKKSAAKPEKKAAKKSTKKSAVK